MKYLLSRFGQSLLLLAGVSLLSFVFLQLAPGDFYSEMRLNPQVSAEAVNSLRAQYGLDQPLPVRYWRWLQSACRGEFGFSFAYNTPVAPLILVRARNTLLLTSIATVLAWCIAVPLGVIVAASPHTKLSRLCAIGTSSLLAVPELLLALVCLLVAVRTNWLRFAGMGMASGGHVGGWRSVRDVANHLVLPSFVLVVGSVPILLQHTVSSVREVLGSPFIVAARAHGVGRMSLLFRHALPVALNPLIALLGTSLASLLSASLMVEVIMGWPGIGPLLLEAILDRDLYVVIGAVTLSAVLLVAGTFFADLLLFAADPRIRAENLT